MTDSFENKHLIRQLIWFFVFLILYTGIFFIGLIYSNNYAPYMNGYMWSPALASLSALAVTKSEFKNLELALPRIKFLCLSLLVPLLYGAISYLLIWGANLADFNLVALQELAKKMGMENWYLPIATLFYLILRGFFGTLGNMPSSFGEELGWRGFLMPRLRSKFSYSLTAIVVGIIWGAWHFPLIIKNWNASSPVPIIVVMINFTLMTIGLSFIFNWITEKSNSV